MDGQKETAGPSTSLRSGSTASRDRRDDKFVAEEGIVVPTGAIMGLPRPPKGMKSRITAALSIPYSGC